MALPPSTQEAVALDYAADITCGATILCRKRKDLHGRSMMINNGHPQWIENWFLATRYTGSTRRIRSRPGNVAPER
ncbi:hypothetical protein ACIQM0_01925 [Streptomyces sp. NPDC091387]|uniref:hypothetical protein n=1 Tax=Streptomyces sp. NPDC091387 TaxID=3365998 RepID=UPI0037FD75F5